MGQELSCFVSQEHDLFSAVQHGDLEAVEALLERDSALLHQTTPYDRQSLLHIASANGQIEVINVSPFFFFFLSFFLTIIDAVRCGEVNSQCSVSVTEELFDEISAFQNVFWL